jgi:chromosome segregation ATPase
MDGLLGKLKQVVAQSTTPEPSKVQAAPVDPSVTRIDLKTASHAEVVSFVKRQNKHIQQLESLLERLELRHKEYKTQLREYADQVQALRSLEYVQGDEGLKRHIQELLAERDALAAELHSQHEKQRLASETAALNPPNPPTPSKEIDNTSSDHIHRLTSELEAANVKIVEFQAIQEQRRAKYQSAIDSQQKEINKLNSQLNQANNACEALKSRLTLSSSQHTSQLQTITTDHSERLNTLNNTISQLQSDLEKIKTAQQKGNTSKISETPLPESFSAEVDESIRSERDSLKLQVQELTKELGALQSQISLSASTSANGTLQSAPKAEEGPQESKSDPLSSPNHDVLQENLARIKTLEDKLQAKHSLLVKAHKHLGELTAQMADANIRVEQLQQEKVRMEQNLAPLAALRDRNAQLERALDETLREFEEYKVKVALHDQEKVSQLGSVVVASHEAEAASSLPNAIQEKLEHMQSEIERLQLANGQLRSANEAAGVEFTQIRAKYEQAVSQLRHLKEKEASRSAASEKQQQALKALEEKHAAQVSGLQSQVDAAGLNATTQLAKLRSKADEMVKQKDAEIAMLKDTIEVLKLQISQSEPTRSHSGSLRPTETSTETSRRRAPIESAAEAISRRTRPISDSRTPSPSRPSTPHHEATVSSASQQLLDDQHAQIQQLLTRLKSSQEQVSELEQLLALSREQEQFLKLELRRNDLPASSSGSTPTPNRAGGSPLSSEFSTSNEFFILRNILKNMLETREIPNLSVFAGLLRFTPEEIQQIQDKADGVTNMSGVVNNGLNAIWNVFGSPQRR